MAFLSDMQIGEMGFKRVGANVLISDAARFYSPWRIEIGDNCRIDDFCILSAGVGGIGIGNNVHIACYSCLIGAGRILMMDYSGLSQRVNILSSTDDYSGVAMTNPTVPTQFTNVTSAPVTLGLHVIIGAGSVVLPNVDIGGGAAIGAMSLVKKDIPPFEIWAGNPIRKIRNRNRELLALEKIYETSSGLR
jgi:dTDP-4-amino-4,6-dideoxy-D-glucose acyltransferase